MQCNIENICTYHIIKKIPSRGINILDSVLGHFTKRLKNQPYDVIKKREMRGEVGKETPKKQMDNPSVLGRHMADLSDTL